MPASWKRSQKRHQSIIVQRINILLAGRALNCNWNYGGGTTLEQEKVIFKWRECTFFFMEYGFLGHKFSITLSKPFSMLKSVGWASTDRIHQVVLGLPLEDPELKCNLWWDPGIQERPMSGVIHQLHFNKEIFSLSYILWISFTLWTS